MADTGSDWRRRWRTRCFSRAGSNGLAALVLLVAGCAKNDPSAADLRRWEVEGFAGEADKAPQLATILVDRKEDELVRALAAAELGEMPAGAAYGDALIAAVEDDSPIVRVNAITACGNLAIPGASSPIAVHLKSDPEASVRRAAARALGKLSDASAVDPLLAAFDDRDLGVQELAAESLRALTGQKFGRDAEAWRTWASTRPK
ncbi:MAG: HEAT repeat domain-containing protein [Planctomycetota bacterium]